MNIVFSSGPFSYTDDGATKCVIVNILPESGSDKFYVLSRGITAVWEQENGVFRSGKSRPRYLSAVMDFFFLTLLKCIVKMHSSAHLDARMKDYIYWRSDKLAANCVGNLLENDPDIQLVMGYSSISLEIGKTAKKFGRLYGIHCEWCHPFVQYEKLNSAYTALGRQSPVFTSGRIRKQLEEFKLADLIWCPSNYVMDSLIKNGVNRDKVFVSYLGVESKRFSVSVADEKKEDFIILFVGNVCIQKGVHILLNALKNAKINDVTMVFNGEQDNIARCLIAESASELARKNIHLKVDPGDPVRYYKVASLFVLPSVHDAFGIVVPEAMAAGLPVIVSDNAGAHEIIEDGKNGFIFPSGDTQRLAALIETFYFNREMVRRFGFESIKVSKYYDVMVRKKITLEKIKTTAANLSCR